MIPPDLPLGAARPSRRRGFDRCKDSGHEWLGEVPEHWAIVRLRFVTASRTKSEARRLSPEREVSFVPMEALGEYGGLSLGETRVVGDVINGYTYFRDGDVVVAKITPCFENGKGALTSGLTCGVGFGTTELHVLIPAGIEPRFLFYVTISDAFRKLGAAEMYGAGGQKRVPEDFIRDFRQPLPQLDEQRAITALLDQETARIDALVKKKERLIELLEEKRTALISRAVTKGLNPNAPMKDSGNFWVPDKPAHWATTKVGYVCRLFSGGTPSKDNLAYWCGSIPWVSPKDMKVFEIDDSEDHVSEEAIEDAGLWLIQPEAVLIVVRGMILAHSFPVGLSKRAVTINQDMKALLPKSNCSAEYLAYLLRGMKDAMLANVEESAHGTKCLRTDVWKGIEINLPPRPEQETICRRIKHETDKVDRLVAKVTSAIERLREYRTALISAAVSGKIDVRGQLPEPEETFVFDPSRASSVQTKRENSNLNN